MRMSVSTCAMPRGRIDVVRAGAAFLLIVAVTCAAGATPTRAAVPSCPTIADFDPAKFSNPTTINNTTLPLVPGAQLVLDGTVMQGGATVPHRVIFTVTDVTKVINGVRTLVIWDVDQQAGQIIEAELSFFAQDDAGNVWNLGEYPEEFLDGTFIGAPSTWIAGLKEAQAGIHMTPTPKAGGTFFLQGFAPDIEFEDCARVAKLNQKISVPAGDFTNVVMTEEKDIFDPASGIQTKFYAPGVGIVQIGAIGDPLAETLSLSAHVQLSGDALENARVEALRLDQRGYQFSDIYGQTPPAERPPGTGPPPPPAAQPPPPPPTVAVASVKQSRLSRVAGRVIVRRALRARLRNWRIIRVSCGFTSGGRLRCTFVAARPGLRLRGSGILRQSSGRVRYRLTGRVTKNDCHPVASRRCSRGVVFSG
jgi:hypothetical protein